LRESMNIALDGDGNLYLTDTPNHRIRVITAVGQAGN
jgi:hypothetical protein